MSADQHQDTAALRRRVDHDFGYHQPGSEHVKQDHEDVRSVLVIAAHRLIDLTPPCREQSLALTKLEEAMFWANAAIARHQPEADR